MPAVLARQTSKDANIIKNMYNEKEPTLRPTHLPLAPSHNEFELLGINEMSRFEGEIMLPGGMRGK